MPMAGFDSHQRSTEAIIVPSAASVLKTIALPVMLNDFLARTAEIVIEGVCRPSANNHIVS